MDKVLTLENSSTDTNELHTQTLAPKKLEEVDGDNKKKLTFDKVFYENEALQETDIVFWELLKQKPLFMIQISTLFLTVHSKSSCEETKWYSITLTILIHCSTFTFTSNF